MPKYNVKLTSTITYEGEVDTDDLEGFEGDEAEPTEVSEFIEAQLDQTSSFSEIAELEGTIAFKNITTEKIELIKDEEEE